MGKKSKSQLAASSDGDPSAVTIASTNNPSYHRVNFLYQASRILSKPTPKMKAYRRISAFYNRVRKEVQSKSRVRIHPYQKRNVCKKCQTILNFGDSAATARLRWKSKRSPHLAVTCMNCKNVKRFVANGKYSLSVERKNVTESK